MQDRKNNCRIDSFFLVSTFGIITMLSDFACTKCLDNRQKGVAMFWTPALMCAAIRSISDVLFGRKEVEFDEMILAVQDSTGCRANHARRFLFACSHFLDLSIKIEERAMQNTPSANTQLYRMLIEWQKFSQRREQVFDPLEELAEVYLCIVTRVSIQLHPDPHSIASLAQLGRTSTEIVRVAVILHLSLLGHAPLIFRALANRHSSVAW